LGGNPIGAMMTHLVDADGNVQMDPPPPGEGIQIIILPFYVKSGTKDQEVYFFDFPSDVDFEIGRIEIATNEGTHHMNCFITPYVHNPDSVDIIRPMVMRKDDGTTVTDSVHCQPS